LDKFNRYFQAIYINGVYAGAIPTTHFTPVVRNIILSAFIAGRKSVLSDVFKSLPEDDINWGDK
jgi:hypothetical protein